jgi:hypothetical protein
MILTHTKNETNYEPIEGVIYIKGGESNPHLVLVNEWDETSLGTYPNKLDYFTYQSMNTNSVLDIKFLLNLWNSGKIGMSTFKLDEELYIMISPLGGTRYNRTISGLETFNFPLDDNELPTGILPELVDWIEDHGYQVSTSEILIENVDVNHLGSDGLPTTSPTLYSTKIITPINEGYVNSLKVSEQVFNLWKSIETDRYMKILPTKSNLGNHIVVTQFSELTGSGNPSHGESYYKEIKSRIQYKLVGSEEINIVSLNLLIQDYSSKKVTLAEGPGTLQLIGSNVSLNDTIVYVTKVVWDKNIIESAIIVDLCMYDNALIQ